MALSLGGVGGFLSGAGGLLGAAGGLFGKKKTGPRSAVRQAVRGARDVGLHGLAALGGGVPFSGVDGGSVIGDLGAALAGAGRAASDYQRDKKREAGAAADRELRNKLAEKEIALADAEILEARSRTILNQANAKRVTGTTVFGTGSHGGLENGDRRVSVEPLRDQIWSQRVEGPGGTKSVGPNPEAFEIGLSELLAGGLIHGPQWLIDAAEKAVAQGKSVGKGKPIPWEMEASP